MTKTMRNIGRSEENLGKSRRKGKNKEEEI